MRHTMTDSAYKSAGNAAVETIHHVAAESNHSNIAGIWFKACNSS